MEKTAECAICLEKLTPTEALWTFSCHPRHIFHRACILWMNDIKLPNHKCPLCLQVDAKLSGMQQFFLKVQHQIVDVDKDAHKTITLLYHPTETVATLYNVLRELAMSWAAFWQGDSTGLFGCNLLPATGKVELKIGDMRSIQDAGFTPELTFKALFPILLRPYSIARYHAKSST